MHKIRPVDVATLPPGGACTTLAPGIAIKYFTAPAYTFEGRTAVAICRRCPVAQMCADRKLELVTHDNGSRRIGLVQEWDRYNRGLRKKPPGARRPRRYREPESLAQRAAREYRRKADLSFEERVYIVFKDAKAGKYKRLNDAIADIVLIHQQMLEEVK